VNIPASDLSASATTEKRLIELLEGITPHSAARLGPATPVFATGFFDSLAIRERGARSAMELPKRPDQRE
jgi:hypothetical protein